MLMRSPGRLATPRLSATAAHLDAAAGVRRYADLSTAEILRRVEGLISELERERNRLVREATVAGVFHDARGDSARTLIEAIENFMGGTVARMEARIAAAPPEEARALAVRLHNAAVNILAAVRGFSPTSELLDDVAATVKDIAEDIRDTGKIGSGVVVVVAVAVLAVVILTRKG